MREDVLLAIIMDCRTSTAIELRYKLGFKKHDSIITKELSPPGMRRRSDVSFRSHIG